MLLFRRSSSPSWKLFTMVLSFWAIACALALFFYSGLHPSILIARKGIFWFFTLPAAVFISCIHYALLRLRATTQKKVIIIPLMMGASVALFIHSINRNREYTQLQNRIMFENSEITLQFHTHYKKWRHKQLTSSLEKRWYEYETDLEKAGGWEGALLKHYKPLRKYRGHGGNLMRSSFYICDDYNGSFTPPEIENFFFEAIHEKNNFPKKEPYQWLLFAEEMGQSQHPMLRAYGLWFQKDYQAYREHAYQLVDAGDHRFIGFGAHATRYDNNPTRALIYLKLARSAYLEYSLPEHLITHLDEDIAQLQATQTKAK